MYLIKHLLILLLVICVVGATDDELLSVSFGDDELYAVNSFGDNELMVLYGDIPSQPMRVSGGGGKEELVVFY